MSLCRVDLSGGRSRAEHTQDAEDEVPTVSHVDLCQFAKRDVAAVAVAGVRAPPTQKALRAVRLPHVQLAAAGVCDEVDALDGGERYPPLRVSRVLSDGQQLVVRDEDVVEAWKRHSGRVGDLDHRI